MNYCRSANSTKKSIERTGASRALPEHAEQERREQRRIHKTEHELNHVHRIVIHRSEIRRANAQQNADDGDELAHPKIVRIGGIFWSNDNILGFSISIGDGAGARFIKPIAARTLIKVVSKDSVERG